MGIMTPKIPAHTHEFDEHPNPDWSTHLACTICGFAIPKSKARAAKNAGAVIKDGTEE